MNFKGLALVLLLTVGGRAQTATLTVVSAASYQPTIAPDSLATIFGVNLARTTVVATLDASGQLPIELAATRVEISGQPASLVYVSPGQINFVVPAGTASGTTAVLVRSTDTGVARSGAVTVATTAPGIFSSDASGHGPGAILNAVTFRPSPFLVITPENGADTRTRLAVYGTGFRGATSMTATATDTSGNSTNLTVEFAGAAPGFFGLDQLNFIVPAQLDSAGAVTLVISSTDSSSNAVTFQMNLLPAAALQLAGVTVSPPFVSGGTNMTTTVSLNGVARSGGFAVMLRSTNLAAQVAPVVTIPEGKVSVDAAMITTPVASVQTGTVVAQAGSVTLSAGFEVDPPNQAQVSGLTITPGSALGGRNLTGKVTLASATPSRARTSYILDACVPLSQSNFGTRPFVDR